MVIHHIGSQPPEDDAVSAVNQARMRCGMIADMAGKLLVARYPAVEQVDITYLDMVNDAFDLAEEFVDRMITSAQEAYDQAKTSEPG